MTDSCPNCCRRGVVPSGSRRRGDQVAHGYVCSACGHRWATARLLPAYSEVHRPAAGRGAASAPTAVGSAA